MALYCCFFCFKVLRAFIVTWVILPLPLHSASSSLPPFALPVLRLPVPPSPPSPPHPTHLPIYSSVIICHGASVMLRLKYLQRSISHVVNQYFGLGRYLRCLDFLWLLYSSCRKEYSVSYTYLFGSGRSLQCLDFLWLVVHAEKVKCFFDIIVDLFSMFLPTLFCLCYYYWCVCSHLVYSLYSNVFFYFLISFIPNPHCF